MEEAAGKLQELATIYGLNLLWAILTFFIGRWVAQFLTKFVRRLMDKAEVEAALAGFAANVTYILLMVVVVLAALNKLGIQTTSFVAILGAAGLAVGFALQGSLSNFAAGVMLIIFRPFKAGDYVEAGGTAGTVEEVQLFTTQFCTPDNKQIIVPNAQITGGKITNYSANDTRRIDLVVGVSYDDDLKKVRSLLESILKEDQRILDHPEPTIGVLELAESSVNFAVRPWVKTADYWGVYFGLMEAVKERFDAEGISIPYPQRDVHVIEENAGPSAA